MAKVNSYVAFHNRVKKRYVTLSRNMWWGDDLDVRFFLLKKLTNIKNKKILDVGCNIGISINFLDKSNSIYGIDNSEFCVNEAIKLNPHAEIHKGSMHSMPYKDKSFDVVIMMNTLPYFDFKLSKNIKDEFILSTFDEIYRVLKDDGVLHLTTPNGSHELFENKKAKLEDIVNLMRRFNFKVKGWNWVKPFWVFKLYNIYINHPKIMSKFEFIWKNMARDIMSRDDVSNAKSFYIEAKKKYD